MKNNMKKFLIWIVVVVVFIGGILFLNNKTHESSLENGSIKIGALVMLSGDGAVYGEGAKRGIDLAVEEFNATHPENQVQIVYEDTHSDPRQAVSGYQKLVNVDRVEGIIGPLFQTEIAAVTPLIKKDNIPVVALSPIPAKQRDVLKNPLTYWPDPTIESATIAEHVYNQGVRKVGVLGTQDSWENEVTHGFANKFRQLGGEITALEIVLPDTSDLRLPISKIIASKPEAVYLGTYMQFIRATKALKDQGYKGRLYSIEIDSYLASETKDTAHGLQFVSLDLYSNNFADKIEARYGQKPNIPVGQAYDATYILLNTLLESETREEALEKLRNLKEYNGVSGRVIFGEDNRASFNTPIFELQDGEIKRINQ